MSKSILRDAFWMAGSTGLRLLSGVVLFVVLARLLGVSDFGNLMMWFAIAGLLSLPTHFGLSTYLLREVPISDDQGASILVDAFLLKGIIACGTVCIVVLTSYLVDFDSRLLWPLVFMHFIESFTELLCVHLRTSGAFKTETRFVTRQAVAQFVVIGLIAWFYPSAEPVAWAFALSRVVSLIIAIRVASREFSGVVFPKPDVARSLKLMSSARAYFADFGVQSTLIQIDVVLLGHLAGAAAVGLYQAAMRFAHGISQVITVLVNVVLPRLSHCLVGQQLDARLSLKVFAAFFVAGVSVSLPLYIFADSLSYLLYGSNYAGVSKVFEVIAMFLLIRFAGAAAGVLLIAVGDQGRRAVVMLLAVICLGLFSCYFMPRLGAVGAAAAMTGTYLVIATTLTVLVFLRMRGARDPGATE